MSGRRLILWFLAFLALFAAALVYFQLFAYYERDRDSTMIDLGPVRIPVSELDKIDARTSPLKLRACFRSDPSLFEGQTVSTAAEPLLPPPWFSCFDTKRIEDDLERGAATAYEVARDAPEGTVAIVALYPDGRGYLWRQLSEEFSD